ncbi:MAG: FAD-binding protein [Solirubrobacterales bacterium]|nr:FAD-binding protein [Solirubrobacterales bacterium]
MALAEPSVAALAPAAGEPSPDAAPDWVASGTPEPLRGELVSLLGADRVLTRASDIVRYASDASPYRLLPRAVVVAREDADVARVLAYGRANGIGVTFRAGGTSLNGQAQSNGILVDVRRHFRGVAVEDEGARARVRPGTVLGHANRVLAPHGARIGPDPASTEIACVGGVIANNAGGMRCGVVHDSYRTVSEMTFVLASGTTIDTAAPDAEARLAAAEPELCRGLLAIREEIVADRELSERIRHKFEIKNTMGYRLCAFLDAETPVEILRRLLVGSEGTLGFVAEAVFETVPQPAATTCAWLHFADIDAAVAPVPDLVAAGARAVELMTAPALIAASYNIRGAPESWRQLDPASAALLVEMGGSDDAELDAAEGRVAEVLAAHATIREPQFHRDPETVAMDWRVREGLHGLVGKLRPPGTALIVEDICVPPARIAPAAKDLQALLGEHGFLPGVAGHASAGNLHFMLTPDFAKAEDLRRYDAFMEGLVDLVIDDYDGSLKAEHGTGLNMAPFVEREWGAKATELMRRSKRLADPEGVLAPGVMLNDDPGVNLRHLKTTPAIEESATACVECGFCEPVCPSRDLTTTPRQRIVLRREMARQPAGSPLAEALLTEFEYDGLETCAADGTCALACPVAINTGELVKDLRGRQHSPRAERVATRLAERWGAVERAARAGLRAGDHGPAARRALGGATRAARRAISSELAPEWPANMPHPAPSELPVTAREDAAAVYLPACVNRIFGRPRGGAADGSVAGGSETPSLPEAMVTISARAGMALWIPEDVPGHCCAVPWISKGYQAGARRMAERTLAALWRWSEAGRLPVVCDASSCSLGLGEEMVPLLTEADAERHAKLEVLDSIAWAQRLLSRLELERRLGAVAVHPPCASRHLELDSELEAIARRLADEVVVPLGAGCCGFAGDRGLLHPELPAAATREQASELAGRELDAHLCSNRTCEIGLQQGTGRAYESFVFTLEELTRP